MTRFAWAVLVDGWAKPVPGIASINATETSNLVIVPPCFAAGGADVRTSSSPGAKYEAWLMELARADTRINARFVPRDVIGQRRTRAARAAPDCRRIHPGMYTPSLLRRVAAT